MISCDFLLDKTQYEDDILTQHFEEKELGYVCCENAYIVPWSRNSIYGGVFDKEKQFIDGTSLHRGLTCSQKGAFEDTTYKEQTVVFLGTWVNIWGHCITDNLRRIWALLDNDFLKTFGECDFVYSTRENERMPESFIQLLSILGIEFQNLKHIDRTIQYSKIIIPDESFWVEKDKGYLFCGQYKKCIDIIRDYGLKNYKKLDNNKFYFTCSRLRNNRQFGEEDLELFFESQGYTIIAPEEFSFFEQLNIFLNCVNGSIKM